MDRRRFAMILAGSALLAVPALAKPNFSGTWKMVPDKSDFGPAPVPEKLQQKIEHNDPDLKLSVTQVSEQGEFNVDFKYTTDGKETTNELMGNPMKTTANWDGDTLVVKSKFEFNGDELTMDEKWSLSDDGKSLTLDRKVNGPQGELAMKIVMAKD